MTDRGRTRRSSRSTTSGPRPNACAGSRSGRRSSPFGPPTDRRFLKAESLQPIGAFKIRGAYVAIASLPAEALARGVITYSSGNHAQGVARAARLLGAPAVIVMPSDAPAIKRDRVAADGAEIVIVGTASDERQRVAESIAAQRGLAIIPPFDDDRIIAGQGTVGLEIVEDRAGPGVVLVPIGGGGLASGVATAIKALRPGVRVIGVEPELAADARASLETGRDRRAGRPRPCRGRSPTGRGRRRSALGRSRTCSPTSTAIVTVSEAEIAAGVRLAAERSRLVVEPSGALRIAAMAFHAAELGLGSGRRCRRGRRQWRQRRSRALPGVPRGAGPAGGVRPRRRGITPSGRLVGRSIPRVAAR